MATSVPRTIGRVDASGSIDTRTALTDSFSGASPRSAISIDGSAFWAVGGADGAGRKAAEGTDGTDPLADSLQKVARVAKQKLDLA